MIYFNELMIHYDVQENPILTLAQVEHGLQPKICHEMMLHTIETIEVVFQ